MVIREVAAALVRQREGTAMPASVVAPVIGAPSGSAPESASARALSGRCADLSARLARRRTALWAVPGTPPDALYATRVDARIMGVLSLHHSLRPPRGRASARRDRNASPGRGIAHGQGPPLGAHGRLNPTRRGARSEPGAGSAPDRAEV